MPHPTLPAFAQGTSFDRLLDGARVFLTEEGADERTTALGAGQAPTVLFITCADSRIDPCRLTGARAGDLFCLRNAGNVVPPHGIAGSSGEQASIAYALANLPIADIVVCGHSDCGAVKALLAESLPDGLDPSIPTWLAHMQGAKERLSASEDPLKTAIEANVAVQLDHLRGLPPVAEKLKAGKVRLHGWVYDIGAGEIRVQPTDGDGRWLALAGSPEQSRAQATA